MHETRLQTRWTDFDSLGHITHAAYPVYFDEARDAFLTETVGPFEEFPWVIAHVSIDYKREIVRPAREIVVRSRVAELGRSSITFEQEASGPDGTRGVVAVGARRVGRAAPARGRSPTTSGSSSRRAAR